MPIPFSCPCDLDFDLLPNLLTTSYARCREEYDLVVAVLTAIALQKTKQRASKRNLFSHSPRWVRLAENDILKSEFVEAVCGKSAPDPEHLGEGHTQPEPSPPVANGAEARPPAVSNGSMPPAGGPRPPREGSHRAEASSQEVGEAQADKHHGKHMPHLHVPLMGGNKGKKGVRLASETSATALAVPQDFLGYSGPGFLSPPIRAADAEDWLLVGPKISQILRDSVRGGASLVGFHEELQVLLAKFIEKLAGMEAQSKSRNRELPHYVAQEMVRSGPKGGMRHMNLRTGIWGGKRGRCGFWMARIFDFVPAIFRINRTMNGRGFREEVGIVVCGV